VEKLSHVAEELESFKKLARNLELKLETDILHHQKEIMEYEKCEKRVFTKQCFSSTAPKNGFFPSPPPYERSEILQG
jgi:hypothetical protein